MRKYVVLACVLAGCGGGGAGQGGAPAGAVGPRQAVEAFLATVKAKDIQAMSLVWGTANGPVRDNMPRDEMEKREMLLQCYLAHDGFRIGEDSRTSDGHVVYKVELTQGTMKRTTNFTTVHGPSDRWYLESVDIATMQDFCRGR